MLDARLDARAFSAVTAEVGAIDVADLAVRLPARLIIRRRRTPSRDTDTIFDLASLTKVIATTTIARRGLVAGHVSHLDAPVRALLSEWTAADRAHVTIARSARALLRSAGAPAVLPQHVRACRLCFSAIAAEPLEYQPRATLDLQRPRVHPAGLHPRTMAPARPLDAAVRSPGAAAVGIVDAARLSAADAAWRPRIAATEHDPWRGRVLQGEVHDENAAALGGVAGARRSVWHGGRGRRMSARWWMDRLAGQDDPATGVSADVARLFVQRSTVPGSSRALGWDTMLADLVVRHAHVARRAIGHTGFTGTSLWIDPAQDLYVVLLTNRVHPTRANEAFQPVRRAFHDAVVQRAQAGA